MRAGALPVVVTCGLALSCGPRMAGTLHRDLTLVHDGVDRSYHLFEPAQRDGPRPLVLLLHGGGGSASQVLGLGLGRSPHEVWLTVADEEGLYLAAPEGIDAHWNDCREPCDRCPEADDEGFLLALVDELVATRDVDPGRVFVLGESNGGFMTQRLALQAPDRFAAFGAVIALLPATTSCAPVEQPASIMYQLGTADTYILHDGGQAGDDPALNVLSAAETTAYWTGLNACEGEPTVTTYDDLDPQDGSTVEREDHACPATGTSVAILRAQGAGHVASSVAVEVSGWWESLVGEQNHDMESARELWAFFAAAAEG
jgi:polyhydroxybutyrate depolymerase